MGQAKLWSALWVARISAGRDPGANARPTKLLPLTAHSALPWGLMRMTPRRPRWEATTNRDPAASNARPWGRPNPRKNTSTTPRGLIFQIASWLEVLGPDT